MKIDHKNTKCCICGSSDTHIKPNGEPFWTRHKDRGIWDRKSYECYKCHYNIGKIHKPRTPKDFFEGRICCICGTDTVNIDNSGTPHWYRCLCSKDKCTGYVCQNCYDRYNPNSSHGKIKLIANCRTGQLNIYSQTGKGILITAVVAKVRKLDVLDIKLDYLRNNVDIMQLK